MKFVRHVPALFYAAIFASVLLCSCERSYLESPPVLADDGPLTSGLGWAVVQEAYARIKAEPSSSAVDLGHARKGDYGKATGRKFGDPKSLEDKGVWLFVELGGVKGWIKASFAELYENEAKAARASAEYGR